MRSYFYYYRKFMRMIPYNVEEMKERFERMSLSEIMEEYFYVNRMRNELLSGRYSEEFVHRYCEPLDEAWDYLGHYLAQHYCSMHDFPF